MKKRTAMKYENLLNNGKSSMYWWAGIQNGIWVLKNSMNRTFKSVDELITYCGGKNTLNEFIKPCND